MLIPWQRRRGITGIFFVCITLAICVGIIILLRNIRHEQDRSSDFHPEDKGSSPLVLNQKYADDLQAVLNHVDSMTNEIHQLRSKVFEYKGPEVGLHVIRTLIPCNKLLHFLRFADFLGDLLTRTVIYVCFA